MLKKTNGIHKETEAEKIAKNINDNLSDLIDARKQETGESQRQQAKNIGLSPSALSKYVNGVALPEPVAIVKMCKYYNCSADYLLGLTNIKSNITDDIAIGNTLGLSDKTIRTLKMWNQDLHDNNLIRLLNLLFEKKFSIKLLKGLLLYCFSEDESFFLPRIEGEDIKCTNLLVKNNDSVYTTLSTHALKYVYRLHIMEVIDDFRRMLKKNNIKLSPDPNITWCINPTTTEREDI